ncbi:cytochrome c biogenesis protein CcdA [Acetobacterium paludosum]|uniref:Cytochrome c biogenesis protein CcdA n=1 Tax=Acetobacterium paludosum TaxID=52693 RepID=A0A923HTP8_9FIRM|nr:cytochrome c biogenesis CcdA family protein [Acetobacterium paludosum]MBC3887537.1 cytochrome c biogenesis protein CcdA [Acetobacterium paludosum]
MNYFVSFLEGIITFISPCLLPMLPIYISYFTGQTQADSKFTVIINAFGFVLGFTFVFILLGAFAGGIGRFLIEYSTIVNLIGGIIIIIFGLNFMDVLHLPFLNGNRKINFEIFKVGFLSSVLFGIVFSIGWTPCVSTFLGSALMLATSSGSTLKGILMLFSFSLGLGIPFMLSAILIDRLKSTFDFIKRNYRIINLISGGLLVIVGILMATSTMGYFLSILSY